MITALIRPFSGLRRAGGSARVPALVLGCFLFGVGVTVFWYHQRSNHPGPAAPSAPASSLSASTLTILRRLNSPLEIRYYALLDPATVPETTRAFAGRVNDLLGKYEQAGNGQIKVVRVDESSTANANHAEADGLKPFNQDKGDACYLGIAVVHGDKKESLPQLAPDWEPALESDLSRAIVRLNESSAVLQPPPAATPVDPAAEAEVKQALPNLASVSVDEGTQVLRQSALDEFKKTSQEMDARIKQAQQQYLEAEKSGSAAGQAAAREQIKALQAEQTQRLQQIVAKSQAQIEALQRLKAAGQK